jgi:putative transposase
MPRPGREDYEGAWQHVMNRGVDRGAVFRSDDDRAIFLDCLAVTTSRFGLQAHAYCLLDNHFHLLLFSESGRLSDGMRFLTGRFTQRINYRDARDGPLFRGRFASVLVKSDAQLVCVSRYIHRNPVEAGLVREAWDWPWSSARAYVAMAAPPAWLRMDVILHMFKDQRGGYGEFIKAEVDEPTRRSYDVMPWGQTRRV